MQNSNLTVELLGKQNKKTHHHAAETKSADAFVFFFPPGCALLWEPWPLAPGPWSVGCQGLSRQARPFARPFSSWKAGPAWVLRWLAQGLLRTRASASPRAEQARRPAPAFTLCPTPPRPPGTFPAFAGESQLLQGLRKRFCHWIHLTFFLLEKYFLHL